MDRKVALTFILGLDCMIDLERPLGACGPPPDRLTAELPAPIFALEAPVVAQAGVPFSLNAWVNLADPLYHHDEVLPETFSAAVDEVTGRIVLTGRIRRLCQRGAQPAGPPVQRALIVGIRVKAKAGMYALEIPPTHYAPAPIWPLEPDEVPLSCAKQWLHVRP